MSAFTNRQMRRHPEMFGVALYAPDGDDGGSGGGGGAGTATMDKPEGLTAEGGAGDTDAGDKGETEDKGTDPDGKGVSGETGEDNKAKTPVLDEETEAVVAARIEEDRQERERERVAEQERLAAEEAEQAHLDELRGHYTTREKNLTEALDAIGVTVTEDMVGQTLRLDQGTRDKLLAELKGYEGDSAASIGLRLRDTLTRQVLASLPEGEREAAKKALDAADPKEFAQAIGEAYAPRAASLKDLDLDGVLGLSPKAKRQQAEAIKKAGDDAKKAERERIYALHGITQDEPDVSGAAARNDGRSEAQRAADRHTPVAEVAETLAKAGVR